MPQKVDMNAPKALILAHSVTALTSPLCYCDSEAHELPPSNVYDNVTLSPLSF